MEQQGLSFGREPAISVMVVVAEESARDEAVRLLYELRRAGVPSDMDSSGKGVKAQMKAAATAKAVYACILGSSEIARGVVAVKEMATGSQEEVERDKVVERLASNTKTACC
jgi:histidyl-tRNA synthetase